MKVKSEYIFRNIAGEYMLIPTGNAAKNFPGLIALSESGSLLYQKLSEECSREALINVLLSEYGVSEAVAARDIDEFLQQMRALDMLVED